MPQILVVMRIRLGFQFRLWLGLCLAGVGVAIVPANAQTEAVVDNTREVRSLVAKAKRHLRFAEYGLARNLLARADSLAPTDPEVMLPYAEVLYHLGQYREALPRMQTAGLQLNLTPELRLMLGKLYLMHNKRPEAKRWLTEALEHPESEPTVRTQAQLGLTQLQHLARAQESFTIMVEHYGAVINTEQAEFGACTNAAYSEMFFTAQRDSNLGGVAANGLPFEDVYAARFNPALGQFVQPRNLGLPINSNLHDAVVGVAPDGAWLLLYRQTNGGDLSIARRRPDSTYAAPEPFPAPINTPARESSGWLSPDGNTLIFNSDRNGGQGGLDLYVATRDARGAWAIQRGAMDALNTPFDEDAPCQHTDGPLYFASQGHGSIGGFDLFYAPRLADGLRWGAPVHLPMPANSPANDNFISFFPNSRVGYFASDRPSGAGNWDIYGIEFLSDDVAVEPQDTAPIAQAVPDTLPVSPLFYPPNYRQPGTQPTDNTPPRTVGTVDFFGVVREQGTNRPMEASIVVTDNSNAEIFARLNSDATTGRFHARIPVGRQFGLAVQADGYSFYSERFDLPTEANDTLSRDITLWPLAAGTRTILRNIYFMLDSDSILSASRTELDRVAELMTQNPAIKVRIEGHCDATGPADYNLALSQRRANSVVRYLVAKGIAADRLTGQGLGESRLLSNENSEAAHAINRRVEFVIEDQGR